MTTTKDLRVFIGATDFGPLGADIVQRFSCGRGGPDRIALADLQLLKEGGGGYAILNRQQVKAYEWTSTNHNPSTGYISAVYFGGFVNLPGTGRAPGSTLKTWKVSAQDYNLQKIRLVVPAAHALGRIEAGTFANQIAQLFVKLQTGAPLAFDYVSRVLNLTGATVLPVIYVNGKNLQHAMEAIFASAIAVTPTLRPVFRLRPDPAVGSAITAWQTPVVDVWDSAAPPSSILTLDEATTTDILARDGYTRVLDSTDQVTKRQSMRKDTGQVSTYTSTAAVATWPNPCDPNGAWWEEPFETDATSTAEQDAELLADVEATANPRETLSLSTQRTPPPDGAEYVDLTLALEGLSAELYGVAGGSTDFVRRLAAPTDSPYLLTTRLDLGLPRVLLGQPGGGSQRRPVTSVPPDVPLNLTVSANAFDWDFGNTRITYTWDPPANPAGVVGYRLHVTTGGVTYTHDVDVPSIHTLYDRMNPGDAFSTTIQSKGLDGRLSVESSPVVGTAAPRPSVPTAPGSLTQTNAFNPNSGLTNVVYLWTASTPGTGCTIDHYEIDVLTPNPGGLHYRHGGGNNLSYVDFMNPGDTARTVVRAYDDHGQISPDSAPVTFTAEATYAPDAPTALTLLARGIGGGGRIGDRPAPSMAWARIGFTPPGTAHGPHDYYLVRWAALGEPVQSNRILGTDTSAIISGTPGVTYAVTIQTYSAPAWAGGTGSISVAMLTGGDMGGGAGPTSDQPLFPYAKSSGTGTPTVDTSDPFDGSSAYKFTSAGVDTQVLAGLPWATVEGRTWTIRTAAKKSGGSPTFAGTVQWSTDGTTWNVLTASALTLPALTTAWPAAYTEQQVKAPTTANFGRLVYTAAFVAAATILAALPQPTPAAGPQDLKLLTASGNPLALYDSTGALRGSIYADGNAPDLIRLHSVTTGGVDSGWELDSTYGDNLQVGDAAANGGISLVPASGKLLTLSGTGEKLNIQSIVETRGSSFPGSPASGDRCYRTDLHRWAYWDGAHWLGEDRYALGPWLYYWNAMVATPTTTAGSSGYLNVALPGDYTVQVERVVWQVYVDGTNDGSNYWTIRLQTFSGTNLESASATTNPLGGATWGRLERTTFAAQPSTSEIGLNIVLTKTGNPGGLLLFPLVLVRDVLG